MRRINKKVSTEYLKVFYPRIRNEIVKLSELNNFAGIMQSIVEYVKFLLLNQKIQLLTQSVRRMNWIYRRGNSYVRSIIENLFIRSFESMKKKSTPEQWKFIYQEIPADFQIIYTEQTIKVQSSV